MNVDSLLGVYLTDSASPESANRTSPEDTGGILRPSTIATVVMDPQSSVGESVEPFARTRIWKGSPVIRPPKMTPFATTNTQDIVAYV